MPNTTATTGIASSWMRVLSAADLPYCVRRRFAAELRCSDVHLRA